MRSAANVVTQDRQAYSWQQICDLYPNEWVVLVDVVHENDDEDNGEIISAVVLGHSKDSGSCLRETKHLRPPGTDCAHLHTSLR